MKTQSQSTWVSFNQNSYISDNFCFIFFFWVCLTRPFWKTVFFSPSALRKMITFSANALGSMNYSEPWSIFFVCSWYICQYWSNECRQHQFWSLRSRSTRPSLLQIVGSKPWRKTICCLHTTFACWSSGVCSIGNQETRSKATRPMATAPVLCYDRFGSTVRDALR